MEDLTKGMRELPPLDPKLSMSNFDHEIPETMETALRAEPGKVYGKHHGWEFNGRVWFDGEKFIEQPWRHGVPREPISAPTLKELHDAVCDVWGYG